MNPGGSSPIVGERAFAIEDQETFARLSGDRNPIHLDPTKARRTMAGQVVVHGVHGALWALETIVSLGGPIDRPCLIRAQFHKFIPLDRKVLLRVFRDEGDKIRAEIVLDGLVATAVHIESGDTDSGQPDWTRTEVEALADAPWVRTLADIDGRQAWLAPVERSTSVEALFPSMSEWLGAETVAALAELSAVVGMTCPGMHSIFSDVLVYLRDTPTKRPGVGYAARLADKRYGRVGLQVAGPGFVGELKALVRPAPIPTPLASDLRQKVRRGEFSDRQALVIGGSRGLGAVAAKLLAMGGADVVVTYASGIEDAAETVADIRSQGESAAAMRLNLNDPLSGDVTGPLRRATHIYYFATPHIARQSVGPFSLATFADFNRFYVERFHEVCQIALERPGDQPLSVFYPSTVFIEERPKGMTEYAMSKSAGEQLCRDLMRAFPALMISAPRLPRVLTDQTASPLPVRTDDPVDIMLPLLRQERPAGAR